MLCTVWGSKPEKISFVPKDVLLEQELHKAYN